MITETLDCSLLPRFLPFLFRLCSSRFDPSEVDPARYEDEKESKQAGKNRADLKIREVFSGRYMIANFWQVFDWYTKHSGDTLGIGTLHARDGESVGQCHRINHLLLREVARRVESDEQPTGKTQKTSRCHEHCEQNEEKGQNDSYEDQQAASASSPVEQQVSVLAGREEGEGEGDWTGQIGADERHQNNAVNHIEDVRHEV